MPSLAIELRSIETDQIWLTYASKGGGGSDPPSQPTLFALNGRKEGEYPPLPTSSETCLRYGLTVQRYARLALEVEVSVGEVNPRGWLGGGGFTRDRPHR